jgi:hypothetical protein
MPKPISRFEVWSFFRNGDVAVSRVRTIVKAETLVRTLSRDPDCADVQLYRKEWCGPLIYPGSSWAYIPVKRRRKPRLENG